MEGLIYKATCKTTGLSYIGQTINLQSRIKQHWYDRKDGTKFHTALLQYGRDDFEWSIIEECDESLLDERERYWIEYYNTYNEGYNTDKGGNYNSLNRNASEDRKQIGERTRNSLTGTHLTEEHKRNVGIANSKAMLGNTNGRGLKGKPKSEQARANMSTAHKGLPSPIKGRHRVMNPDGTYSMK